MPGPTRVFHHRQFDADALAAAKAGRQISLCLPAKDEAATIGAIVERVRADLMDRVGLVDEVVVVDDGSHDDTGAVARAAGARVVETATLLPECGPGTGKGEALWKSVFAASGDIIAWCDADIVDFDSRFVLGLVGPLLTDPSVEFVKGFYDRPVEGTPGTGGRTTELVARPLLALLFPALAAIIQPLAGEYAGRRPVLEAVPFVQGYGVDLGLLVDVSKRFGMESIAQVDLGTRVHRNRTLDQLSPQALAIMQTAFVKAGLPVPAALQATLLRPGLEPLTLSHVERTPLVALPAYLRRSA